MEYLNHRRLIEGEGIVRMGQLIKIMLMGHDCGPLHQVERLHYGPQDESPGIIDDDYHNSNYIHDKRVFCVQGSFLGFIASTGPSTRDIVAKMDAVSVWHKALLRNFPHDLGPATFESNKLLRAILDSTDAALENHCLNHVNSVQWRPLIREHYRQQNVIYNEIKSGRVRALQDLQATKSNSNDSQLIQLMAAQQTRYRRKMGIAAPEARPGDLIYSIPGVKHCVTLRLTGGTAEYPLSNLRLQVYGTSRLVGDEAGLVDPDSLRGQSSRDVYENPELIWSLEIKMDARTLFVLLS